MLRAKLRGDDLRKEFVPVPVDESAFDDIDAVVISGLALTWGDWFDIAVKAWVAFLTVGVFFGILIGIAVALVMLIL